MPINIKLIIDLNPKILKFSNEDPEKIKFINRAEQLKIIVSSKINNSLLYFFSKLLKFSKILIIISNKINLKLRKYSL